MTVTVYTKPACTQCVATKAKLKSKGIDFTVVDIYDDPASLDRFLEMGLRSAPIVEAGDQVWSGFREDRIEELAEKLAA